MPIFCNNIDMIWVDLITKVDYAKTYESIPYETTFVKAAGLVFCVLDFARSQVYS